MDALLLWIGRTAGIAGAVVSTLAVALRLAGFYWLAGFQLGTLLQAGIAAMVLACLCFLALLTERARRIPG